MKKKRISNRGKSPPSGYVCAHPREHPSGSRDTCTNILYYSSKKKIIITRENPRMRTRSLP